MMKIVPALLLSGALLLPAFNLSSEASANQKSAAKKAPAQKAGARKVSRTAVYSLPSMHCEGCAGGLTQASRNWPGVTALRFNVSEKRTAVTYDAKVTNPQKIQKHFERTGFPAKLSSG